MAKITFSSSGRDYKWAGNWQSWFTSKERLGSVAEGDVRIIRGLMFHASISYYDNFGIGQAKGCSNKKIVEVRWMPVDRNTLTSNLDSNKLEFRNKIIG